ncbi:MAG: hypothetical protein A2W25_03325 [candidate division Zixibacteria bacterium RBG_16_53_22]|nr:MAG: hypothetical protein A2W25_03325 [candidate division Zixibacteria bacterium RBG_16_53_22]
MRRVFVALVILASIATRVSSRIINIPTDYPTIQAGIDASANGDTMLVGQPKSEISQLYGCRTILTILS